MCVDALQSGTANSALKPSKKLGTAHQDYSNIYPTRFNFTQIILFGNCSICFGWYLHPSSGAHKTVPTTSDICHTVIAICRYREELELV
jgi:hypothetical protein